MARIELKVTMRNIYKYSRPAYGYGMETAYIYSMVDEDGKVYVWKTTAFMGIEVADPNGWIIYDKKGSFRFEAINQNDVIRIAATVNGESEYNGEPQTELTRVKVKERIFKAKTPEEIEAEKRAEKERKRKEQMESIKDGDQIRTMGYKQYKEHYPDCEVVIDSYDAKYRTVKVIVRDGRMKNSGVRDEHFMGFEIIFMQDGKECRTVYRAVNEENAFKRFRKEFPDATDARGGKIYHYGRTHRYF